MRTLYRSALLSVFGLFVPSVFGTPVVNNPGFEDATTPALSGNDVQYTETYGPITNVPGWTFGASGGGSSYDGMSSGVTFANENQGPNSGNQNAFVQGTGTISQDITFTPGYYTVSVYAVARTNAGESIPEPTAVSVGATTLTFGGVPQFQAIGGKWSQFTSDTFHITTGGSYTLEFSGTVPLTVDDNLTGLDDVSIATALPEPACVSLLGIGAFGLLARRRRV